MDNRIGTKTSRRKLIYDFGINDADYVTQIVESSIVEGKRKQKKVWTCPFYKRWVSMIKRCYSEKWKQKYPTYADCYVCEEWRYFSTFKKWMEAQSWEGKSLDKDILGDGKVYSPNTCCFVLQKVNSFVTERSTGSTGTSFNEDGVRFRAKSIDVGGKDIFLGVFDTRESAHLAWKQFKLKTVNEMMQLGIIEDMRVFQALVDRYTILDYSTAMEMLDNPSEPNESLLEILELDK